MSPDDDQAPYDFTGDLSTVTIDVSGAINVDSDAEFLRLMAQQVPPQVNRPYLA